jgi:alpha-beta hydrolase superfamily lysophospholipase
MVVPSYPGEDEARHEEGFVNSTDHLRLFWQRYTPPRALATVAILHGAADHSGRFPAITTHWAFAHGAEVDGFVLSSPWLRLGFQPPLAKLAAAKVLGRFLPWLPISAPLDSRDLTSDPELQRWTERDPLYGRAATPRWFDQARRAQREACRRAAEFEAPVLVLAAGADRIADVGATRRFVDEARSLDKRLVVYEGFRHELFNEVRRQEPIGETVAWLTSHAANEGDPAR